MQLTGSASREVDRGAAGPYGVGDEALHKGKHRSGHLPWLIRSEQPDYGPSAGTLCWRLRAHRGSPQMTLLSAFSSCVVPG